MIRGQAHPGGPPQPLGPFDAIGEMTPREFDRFRTIIHETAGIYLSDAKRELLRARLGKVMRRRGIPSYAAYLRMIEADDSGDEISMLLDVVSTNLTSFFREADHFRFLTEHAVPEIVAARGTRGPRTIRAWSAGCSTGEEPYSIAITLLESLRPEDGWDIRLLGTDLSNRAIARAKEGLYSAEKLEQVPRHTLARYFGPGRVVDGRALSRVSADLRRMVTFARLNLFDPYPFKGPFDFIFCRNVMIYFDRETQKMLIDRLCSYLAGGGYLFIGHSESLNGIPSPLTYVRPSVYRKTRPHR